MPSERAIRGTLQGRVSGKEQAEQRREAVRRKTRNPNGKSHLKTQARFVFGSSALSGVKNGARREQCPQVVLGLPPRNAHDGAKLKGRQEVVSITARKRAI